MRSSARHLNASSPASASPRTPPLPSPRLSSHPISTPPLPQVRVRYYNGKPYEVDDLLKVAVYAAERVIVLGCSRRPRVADSQMLTTICALRCLPGARFLTKVSDARV